MIKHLSLVQVWDIRFIITPQISPGCHGNMILYLSIPPRLDEIKKGWVTETQVNLKLSVSQNLMEGGGTVKCVQVEEGAQFHPVQTKRWHSRAMSGDRQSVEYETAGQGMCRL